MFQAFRPPYSKHRSLLIRSGLLFFALFFGCTSQAHVPEYSKVAIAIAAAGPGASMMGHAFLLFLNDPKKISESLAVQFNLAQGTPREGQGSFLRPISEFFGYGRDFQVQFAPGLPMINAYRRENRPVILYFLRMTPQQIGQVLADLKNEGARRDESPIQDYGFMTKNCLTESLRTLNRVLPTDQHFSLIGEDDRLLIQAINLSGAIGFYLKNAPAAAAPSIARHPLVESKVIMTPALITEGPRLVEMLKKINAFADACSLSTDFRELSLRISGQAAMRSSESFLRLLTKLKNECRNPQGPALFTEILGEIYLLAPSLDEKMRVEKFLR